MQICNKDEKNIKFKLLCELNHCCWATFCDNWVSCNSLENYHLKQEIYEVGVSNDCDVAKCVSFPVQLSVFDYCLNILYKVDHYIFKNHLIIEVFLLRQTLL